MKYENIREGIFLKRPNRFIAHVEIDEKVEICHVKNTGRCRESRHPCFFGKERQSKQKDPV